GGLRPGDVLLELDGRPILDRADLRARLSAAPPGAMLRFYLLRQQAARYLAFPKRWRGGE
ncbi:MAG TPA: PDZ domain-containing protein, partial [Myxococcota bacterium]|nr:PDZ domain-containing protein [Myxococcota bacterium]